jgi:hypothetical protein
MQSEENEETFRVNFGWARCSDRHFGFPNFDFCILTFAF